MESKVVLYDSNDVKIGETFIRRARQLIRQQRAAWTDDSQTAIRFVPGMENMENAAADTIEKNHYTVIPDTPAPLYNDNGLVNWLIPLAEKRMRARRMFVMHTFIFIPVAIYLFNLFGFRFIDPLVAWTTPYMLHAYLYATNKFARKRIAKTLSSEAAMLRSEQCKL